MIAVSNHPGQLSQIPSRLIGPAPFDISISYCQLERRVTRVSSIPILPYVSAPGTEIRLFNAYAQSLGVAMRFSYSRIIFGRRRVHPFSSANPTAELMVRAGAAASESLRTRRGVASNPLSWRHR